MDPWWTTTVHCSDPICVEIHSPLCCGSLYLVEKPKSIHLVLTGQNALSFSMPHNPQTRTAHQSTLSYRYLGTVSRISRYQEPSSMFPYIFKYLGVIQQSLMLTYRYLKP